MKNRNELTADWVESVGFEYIDWLGEYEKDGVSFKFVYPNTFFFVCNKEFIVEDIDHFRSIYTSITKKYLL